MGPVCTAQKRKNKAQEEKDALRASNQPCLESTSLAAGQSLPLELKNQSGLEEAVQNLMQLFKRFTMFLELVGNLSQLPQHTRDKLNNCIAIKQNISIIIQNNVKRVMREQQIIKRIDESDYYLIYNDRKFASTFNQMMSKLANLVLTELKPDEDFQNAFPILAVSFEEEAQKINNIVEKLKNNIIVSIRKGSSQHSISINQQQSNRKASQQ
ncbi:unnamed protein product (macronuclear) [Paramecium tetraurelia]|uniref:Uncharacterized protein n=1 Tax=Paramecium tetraurelia TaxID=5888 RepID=A0DUU7_PARTE|nr:uncharacterized protein GSPATT00020476001 [Paramecium tetraurelia]CAK86814.1 unnamed protein product [Paramecium tetraurelia]|eukprot:XP_001454211.1 hypothetical protein (macronuclear) [Paramecium tetraurelia strain d4-2]